jgi:hypothetical protein
MGFSAEGSVGSFPGLIMASSPFPLSLNPRELVLPALATGVRESEIASLSCYLP